MISIEELTGQNRPSFHVEPRAVVRWEDAQAARDRRIEKARQANLAKKRRYLEIRLAAERKILAETQVIIDAIMAEYAKVRE